jgi:hypothetical protein
MKNKISALILLLVSIITLTSCYASRSKYGCPATQMAGRFKG